jgi:hypothetical protein
MVLGFEHITTFCESSHVIVANLFSQQYQQQKVHYMQQNLDHLEKLLCIKLNK